MYCPKCGTQNIENASFCRGCGTNLTVVSQALTGRPPEAASVAPPAELDRRTRRQRKRDRPPRLDSAITTFFMGLAFIFVAFAVKNYMPGGHVWWFWMFLPAFGMIGGGIAEYARLRESRKAAQLPAPDYAPPAVAPPHAAQELPPRPAADYYPPASVTENTTQLLDRER
ncbi:MAG TPA: zinc ribbon domain-containing protein [Pyrinomonadaceae bacterium]|jgi:hypothetical protein